MGSNRRFFGSGDGTSRWGRAPRDALRKGDDDTEGRRKEHTEEILRIPAAPSSSKF